MKPPCSNWLLILAALVCPAVALAVSEETQVFEIESEPTTTKASDGIRPNIVFFMADDWSWPHAGILGDPVVKTPHFDRVAGEGVLFENAFVSTPSCTPSRLSILAGQHHWRLKEGDSLGGSLREEFDVYTEMLRDAGYRIGRYGKGVWPSKHAFRHRDSFGKRFRSFDEFIKDRKPDEPFCYWHGGEDPHRPYELKIGVKSGIELSKVKIPACLPDHETVRSDVADYLWEVQRFDREVGEVLAQLETMGELDDTIIVVSGDNGMPFPRCKATLYDQGTRVPLAIRWGARVEGNRRVTDFVSLCDLAPTFLEAAGLRPSLQMTGRSLMPILASKDSGEIDPTRTFVLTGMERHVYPYPCRALRTKDFLYIRNFAPGNWPTGEVDDHNPKYDFTAQPWPTGAGAFSFNIDPSPSKQFLRLHRGEKAVERFANLAFSPHPDEELYDLRNDPGQLNNVAGAPSHAEVKQRLSGQLDAELIKSNDPRMAAAAKLLAADARKPNVLFIIVDDLRPELGCYGNREIQTPHFDEFAKSAMTFMQAYCPAAACAPSRASAMTGLRPDSTRVWDLKGKFRVNLPNVVTLPQHFHKYGYHTVSMGKIFHNHMPDRGSFDEPDLRPKKYMTPDMIDRDPESFYHDEKLNQELARVRQRRLAKNPNAYADGWAYGRSTESFDAPDSEFYDGAQTDLALETLRRLKNKVQPFFLALGYYRPHLPFVAPKKYWDLYERDQISMANNPFLPTYSPIMAMNSAYELKGCYDLEHVQHPSVATVSEEAARRLKHGYYASVSFVDACFGKLMNGLDELGLDENTIVVVWGDHGWKLGEHGSWCKQTNYDIDIRVPLLMRIPAISAKGACCHALVELVDLFPTLCDVAGIEIPDNMEGTSFKPLLQSPELAWKSAAFSQFHRNPKVTPDGQRYMGYSMVTPRYHYVEWRYWDDVNKVAGDLAAVELYDRETDPDENTNVAEFKANCQLVEQLSRQLQRGWRYAVPEASPVSTKTIDKSSAVRSSNR